MSTAEAFGSVLRRRREAAGLTQEELAHRAGLHRTTVGLLERGQRSPTLAVVRLLAGALGTTATRLVAEFEAALPRRADSEHTSTNRRV